MPLKFCSLLDVPFSLLLAPGHGCARLLTPSPLLAARALRQHASQWVWFRALFIVFARCAYVNTLVRVAASADVANK